MDLSKIRFYAINDVKNPLYGTNGAAYVYAAQKGADEELIHELDEGLKNLSYIFEKTYGDDFSDVPGSGAAGGTGFGLKAFLGAEFLSGVEFILELSEVKSVLDSQQFDYIVTGEGRIDDQTLSGKLIQGVMDLAKKYTIPVLAVCGKLEVSLDILTSNGVRDVIEIGDPNKPLEYNMKNGKTLLENSVAAYFEKRF
ncbi:glycerate kinase [Maribacter litopenaei]|uniref:Glycerate kinase n=1 Tax=Maribacter litopenaei TaxID=2976127 RepID=A0ABY5Y6P7_9FLAO|nr:glycerate kinase [Maribacter litopenaei]UWX54701.1 glycerate kinase [Maribacter litopenaei]